MITVGVKRNAGVLERRIAHRAGLTKARTELDWRPTRPTLIEEFRQGSYRK